MESALRLLIQWHITPITCRLELAFFFAQIRNNRCMSCLRNAIESKTAWHVSCRASGNIAVVCFSFISEMKPNKDKLRYKQINCRPDYILERIHGWCRFWKLCCFVIGTWPKRLNWTKLARRVQIMHLKARARWHKTSVTTTGTRTCTRNLSQLHEIT